MTLFIWYRFNCDDWRGQASCWHDVTVRNQDTGGITLVRRQQPQLSK